MLRKILIAVVAVLAVLAVFIATRPSTYAVERSLTMAASPEIAFAAVEDFHRWESWSPWAKLDPAQKTTYSGAPAGKGAICEWSGNKEVGKGRMTILEAKRAENLAIDLEFMEPFASRARTSFTFAPEGGGTKVSWSMKGDLGFVEKAFSIFASMDSMVGKDFAKGLAQLKTVAEADQAKWKEAEAARVAALEAKAKAEAAAQAAAAAKAKPARKAKPAAKKRK